MTAENPDSFVTFVRGLVHTTEDLVDDLLRQAEGAVGDLRNSFANAAEGYTYDEVYDVEKEKEKEDTRRPSGASRQTSATTASRRKTSTTAARRKTSTTASRRKTSTSASRRKASTSADKNEREIWQKEIERLRAELSTLAEEIKELATAKTKNVSKA